MNWIVLSRAVAFPAAALLASAAFAQEKINPTDPQPTCQMCPGTLIPLSELDAYMKKAIAERLLDPHIPDIKIGKAHVGNVMHYRRKLHKPRPDWLTTHELVN